VFGSFSGMPAPTDTPLPVRYRDATLVARGGMGEIYRATDQELARDVAVKVLAERYAEDDEIRERFRREALTAARLSGNANIVTIFDVEEHEGRPMIVMELMSGGSLEKRLSGSPCSPAQALEWLEEAAAALDAAHAAGIVHRDVKPGNLLLDGEGRVHVADFGIASAADLLSFTQTGTILGTAGYLSPEQARGERASAASDRYALAVVAWELLAGRRPFAADNPTTEAAAHVHAPVPSIHDANPSLPRSYDAVFRRALAKEPAARYPSAAEFVGELRRELRSDAGDTWVDRTAVAPPPAAGRRSRLLPALLALAALALIGVAAALVLTRDNSPTTVVRTVTGPGTTVRQTVTTQPTTAPSTAPSTTTSSSGQSGTALNNAGYAKMRAGDYAGALPLLEQAVQKLNGTGALDEAYADYNLAYTRFALGDCTDVLTLLDRSQQIQGHRHEIDQLRHDAQKRCGGKHGKGNGDGNEG
jgi:eukaryotic-like serine/threonine-protein kinase